MGRVLKKKGVIIWFVIEILIVIGAAVSIFFMKKFGLDLSFSAVMNACFTMATVIVGIPVFLAVFKDGLQSKSMQNAIGMGASRDSVVIARFIETSIIFVISFVIIFVVVVICGIPYGIKMSEYMTILKDATQMLLSLLCYTSISMIVVFGTMNTSFAQTVFLLLNLGVVASVIQVASLVPFFSEHHINLNYVTIGGLIELTKDKTFAMAPLMWVVIVGAYMVLPLIISIVIFRRKELDL